MSRYIEWSGDKELLNALARAYSESRSQARAVIRNNTEQARAKAKSMAPYDTGFLHDNIDSYYASKVDWIDGFVHSRATYSGFLEWGTRKMSAQPFMRPAVEGQSPQLKQDLLDVARGLFR